MSADIIGLIFRPFNFLNTGCILNDLQLIYGDIWTSSILNKIIIFIKWKNAVHRDCRGWYNSWTAYTKIWIIAQGSYLASIFQCTICGKLWNFIWSVNIKMCQLQWKLTAENKVCFVLFRCQLVVNCAFLQYRVLG